jgi:SAM-dependent methyltransferase
VDLPQAGDVGKAYDHAAEGWDGKIADPFGYHFWAYGVFDKIVQPYADRAGRILDIGCGTGAWLADQRQRDRAKTLVGIDLSSEMVSRARKRSCGVIVHGQAECLPFKEDAFNLVVSRGDAITQAYRPLQAFSEVSRVLAPGGHLCLEMAWGSIPFEGICREDADIIYRRDTIGSEDVRVLIMKRYHLPEDLRGRAERELGKERYHSTKWPERWVAKATSVEERHMLIGEEGNVKGALSGAGLSMERILGTGVMGWLFSTRRLPKGAMARLTASSDAAMEVAAALSGHIDLRRSKRVTVVATKPAATED